MSGGFCFCLGSSLLGEDAASFLLRVHGAPVVAGGSETPPVPVSDARILPVFFRSDGKKERLWTDVMELVEEVPVDYFGVDPPRTTMWCLDFLRRQNCHPNAYHETFKIKYKLSNAGWGVVIHGMALKTVALAGCVDQCDLPNLACVENLFRQAQMVEHFYYQRHRGFEEDKRGKGAGKDAKKDDKSGTSVGLPAEEIDLFLGTANAQSAAMGSPQLIQSISKELERGASIAKQARKAREERALARV